MTTAPGDPTPRTIDQLNQAIAGQRELFEAKLENMWTKFEGYDKAILLLQEIANSQPTPGILEERLAAVQKSMDNRFQGLKELRDALAVSDKESLNLALQAAEKAATKSEGAFNKQLDALADRVNDIKDRTINMEAGDKGSKQSYGVILGVASFAVAFTGVIILLVSKLGS